MSSWFRRILGRDAPRTDDATAETAEDESAVVAEPSDASEEPSDDGAAEPESPEAVEPDLVEPPADEVSAQPSAQDMVADVPTEPSLPAPEAVAPEPDLADDAVEAVEPADAEPADAEAQAFDAQATEEADVEPGASPPTLAAPETSSFEPPTEAAVADAPDVPGESVADAPPESAPDAGLPGAAVAGLSTAVAEPQLTVAWEDGPGGLVAKATGLGAPGGEASTAEQVKSTLEELLARAVAPEATATVPESAPEGYPVILLLHIAEESIDAATEAVLSSARRQFGRAGGRIRLVVEAV